MSPTLQDDARVSALAEAGPRVAGGSGMEAAACADYARRWLARASCVRISFSRCSGRHGFKR